MAVFVVILEVAQQFTNMSMIYICTTYMRTFLTNSGQSQGGNTCTLGNGQPLQMAIRPEYRMLSDSQRNRYHAAINTLKRSGVFDQIATIHSNVTIAGSAHGAPSFLPWHREFIKRSNKFWGNFIYFCDFPFWLFAFILQLFPVWFVHVGENF